MGKIESYILNNIQDLKTIIEKKLKVVDLQDHFTKLLKRKNLKINLEEEEEECLKKDYLMWKQLKLMFNTPYWHKNWATTMKDYMGSLNTDLLVEDKEVSTEDENTLYHAKSGASFASFLAKVEGIRKKLGLKNFQKRPKTEILSEKDVFERLDISKEVDPDFSTQSTYYVSEEDCLSSQVTPYYLKSAEQNTLSYFKVFRRQNPDKTHLCEFYQLEYVKKYYGLDPVNELIKDFVKIYRMLGLKGPIHIRPTRNNYTYPSFEFFTALNSEEPQNLVEVGNSGIMDPLILKKSSSKYDQSAHYLAGAIGLERLYNIINKKGSISEAKNDYYF